VAALEWFDRSTWPVLQLAFGHTATVLQDWWAMREIHRPRPGP